MKNPELIALVTCDATAVDPVGKVTLYGLFDVIWTTSLPTRHPQLTIFCKCRFATPGVARVEMEGPDGSSVLTLDPFKAEQAGNAQIVYNLTRVEFANQGTHLIRLVGPDGPVGATTLEVRVRQ
jgi:hypothetical protein